MRRKDGRTLKPKSLLSYEDVPWCLDESLVVAPQRSAQKKVWEEDTYLDRPPTPIVCTDAGGKLMEVVYPRCCGIDVHERFVVACLTRVDQGLRYKELRRFDTFMSGLSALREWLLQAGCIHAALESTGVYWRPVLTQLSKEVEILIVNAQHMKAVPQRKIDIQDAEWIADLLQHGLLTKGFVPPVEQQELCDLTRLMTTFVQERARLYKRVHKLLEEANIKLSSVLSHLFGASVHAILQAMAQGETDAQRLANLVHRRLDGKRELLVQALEGGLSEHYQFLLAELLTIIQGMCDLTLVLSSISKRILSYNLPEKRLERNCLRRKF